MAHQAASGTAHGHAAPAHGTDPHHEGHHEHVIMSPLVLWGVLIALLGLTALTMGASYAEKWVAGTWDVVIPQWVNAAIAMSIALVKGLLVCLFFMQLKYDNKINAVIMGFTVFAVALFLGFTMIDLGSRGTIYDYKSREIQTGGQGISTTKWFLSDALDTGGKPVVVAARERKIEALGLEGFEKAKEAYEKKHGHAAHEHVSASSASRQVIRSGLTKGLFDADAGEKLRPPAEHGLNR